MRGVRVGGPGIIAVVVVAVQLAAAPARADVIYDYRGNPFTFCGFGCPGNEGNNAAPVNWDEDYLIASLTFAAPLAPNLTFDDDVRPGLVGWTAADALGTFSLSGTELPDVVDDGVTLPGLALATDAAGNIIQYAMTGDFVTMFLLFNPPLDCTEECGTFLADLVAVNIGLDDSLEWDAGNNNPGTWTLRRAAVPEPTMLALGGVALAGLAVRKRRRRSTPTD